MSTTKTKKASPKWVGKVKTLEAQLRLAKEAAKDEKKALSISKKGAKTGNKKKKSSKPKSSGGGEKHQTVVLVTKSAGTKKKKASPPSESTAALAKKLDALEKLVTDSIAAKKGGNKGDLDL
jgi:hypothetical protein